MAIFDYEWCDDVEPSSDRVSQYTMASVFIKVGDHVVTSLYDRYLKEYRDRVFVPLAHVAEWLAANWWHLWYEAAYVSGEQRPGFPARHDLAHAGNGFVLPRLTFVPVGDRIRAKARGWRPEHAPLEFRAECDVMLDRDDMEQEFRSLVGDVIERLRKKRAPLETLESEWRAIESLDHEEREFCQAAALMGLDPFDIDAPTADRIARVWNQTNPALRAELLGAASQDHSLDTIDEWSGRCLESAERGRSGSSWRTVRHAARRRGANGDLPWQRGNDDARAVRKELAAEPGRFDFEQSGQLGIWNREDRSPSPRIDGIVASDSPSCVVIRKPKEEAKRFLLARARLHRARRTHPRHTGGARNGPAGSVAGVRRRVSCACRMASDTGERRRIGGRRVGGRVRGRVGRIELGGPTPDAKPPHRRNLKSRMAIRMTGLTTILPGSALP